MHTRRAHSTWSRVSWTHSNAQAVVARRGRGLVGILLIVLGLGCMGTFLVLQFLSGEPVGSVDVSLDGKNPVEVTMDLDPSMNPVAVFFEYEVESDRNERRLFEGRGILRGPSGQVLHEKGLEVTQSRRERRRLSSRLLGADESGTATFATLDVVEAGPHAFVLEPGQGFEDLVSAGWSVRRNVTPAPGWLMLTGIGALLLGALLKRFLG